MKGDTFAYFVDTYRVKCNAMVWWYFPFRIMKDRDLP